MLESTKEELDILINQQSDTRICTFVKHFLNYKHGNNNIKYTIG